MNPFARYTLMRILVFGVVLGVLATFHVRGFVLLLGTLAISAAVSYLLLAGPRQALVARLEARAAARVGRRRHDPDAEVEDEQVDRGADGPRRLTR